MMGESVVAMPVGVAPPTVTPGRGDRADDRAACRPDCRASERRAGKASRRQSADSCAADAADDRAACGALSGSVTARERQRSDERDDEKQYLPRPPSIRESNHRNNLPLSASRRLYGLCGFASRLSPGQTSDRIAPIAWSRALTLSARGECACGRREIVDVSDLPGSLDVPALAGRFRRVASGARPMDVIGWTGHERRPIT